MQTQASKLLWNGVFVAILLSLCGLIYLSGEKIDYNWNWQRVVPYIVNNEASSVTAPQDGSIVKTAAGKLKLVSDSGEVLVDLAKYENISVYEGDLVFEGDQLAASEH